MRILYRYRNRRSVRALVRSHRRPRVSAHCAQVAMRVPVNCGYRIEYVVELKDFENMLRKRFGDKVFDLFEQIRTYAHKAANEEKRAT